MTFFFKKTKVSVSVYFACVLTFLCILAPQSYAPTGLVCCVLHEAGHLAAIKIFGGRVKSINLGIYGMRIECARNVQISFLKEAAVSFAGPAVNIALFAAGLFTGKKVLCFSNAALIFLNLLPAYSTDGYEVIKNILLHFFDGEKIKTALKLISAAGLAVMYFLSVFLLLRSGFNFSLLAVSVYLTVRFLFQGNQPYP